MFCVLDVVAVSRPTAVYVFDFRQTDETEYIINHAHPTRLIIRYSDVCCLKKLCNSKLDPLDNILRQTGN